MLVNASEFATILAALRYFQDEFQAAQPAELVELFPQFESAPPLSWAEIGALCERLNISAVPERFAQVAWSVEDVTDVYEVTDQQAIELLLNSARDIQEQMVERGWDVIDSLAKARSYQRRD